MYIGRNIVNSKKKTLYSWSDKKINNFVNIGQGKIQTENETGFMNVEVVS